MTKIVWLHYGRFFSQTHLVTLVRTNNCRATSRDLAKEIVLKEKLIGAYIRSNRFVSDQLKNSTY
jgi:hypothetical protein